MRSLLLTLIVTLFLMTAAKAQLATAQQAPATDKSVNSQLSPSVKTLQPRLRRTKRPDSIEVPKDALPESPQEAPKEAPKEAEPVSDPSVPAAAVPAPAAPQPADDRLPFMAGNERESHEQPPTASGLLLRTVGALLLIVGLIVAAAWGMKRFGGARFGTPKENAPALAILNSLSLGERRSLTIVRFGDRTLLLGSTAQSVTLLAEAENDDFVPPESITLARSVADILNDDKPANFSQELFSANEHLDEQLETRRGIRYTT
jgi:flagellar biosynthetic protein FliO